MNASRRQFAAVVPFLAGLTFDAGPYLVNALRILITMGPVSSLTSVSNEQIDQVA